MKLKNIKWEEEKFLKERNDVLKGWITGSQVDIEESINYHKSILKNKVSKFVLKKAKEEGKTLTQPRAGVALINDHIKLLQYLEKEGMADFLPTTIDSYTRLNRYEEAQKGIDESIRLGRSMLNGFPAVNHGVDGCRKVVESVNVPVEVRHGTPDSRLLAEITLAGGFTDFEGGAITYNVPYSKDVSIETSIKNWQIC
ncbi:Glutamate mutase epsilon subunit [subsurface metagenome]